MDDDVARAQLLPSTVVKPEAVSTEVDLDDVELRLHQLGEAFFAQLFLQPLERRAGEDLTLEALQRRPACAGADRKVDARDIRDRAQALLDDRLAQEAGAAGDQDGLALEGVGDHYRVILG